MWRRLPSARIGGFTLVEIVIVVVILGLLLMLAAPNLTGFVAATRRRGALDRVATSIYYARGVAVESGRTSYLVLRSADGCVDELEVSTDAALEQKSTIARDLRSADNCLQYTGDSVFVFNSRGILRPPSRSVFSTNEGGSDSVVISIAGRVRRTY